MGAEPVMYRVVVDVKNNPFEIQCIVYSLNEVKSGGYFSPEEFIFPFTKFSMFFEIPSDVDFLGQVV